MSQTSKSNNNSSTTTKYRLKKLFLVLEHYQDDVVLEGCIYLDEAFYKVRSNEIANKPDDKEYRGLSGNQYCIGIAFDGKRTYLKIEGKGMPSFKTTDEIFCNHLKMGAVLIVDKYKLTSEAFDGNTIKKMPDYDKKLFT